MIIIGDVHGCYDKLMELIKILPKGEQICFVGDLIDRGPKSKEVVEFVIGEGHLCVRGNHEQYLVDHILHPSRHRMSNNDIRHTGVDKTYASYAGKKKVYPYLDKLINYDHIKWMDSLPLFLEFDPANADNRKLLVAHTGLSLKPSLQDAMTMYMMNIKAPDTYTLEQSKKYYEIDGRCQPGDFTEIFQVFGHTPMKHPVIEKHFAAIDTGCVFGYQLTALRWPQMEIYQV